MKFEHFTELSEDEKQRLDKGQIIDGLDYKRYVFPILVESMKDGYIYLIIIEKLIESNLDRTDLISMEIDIDDAQLSFSIRHDPKDFLED